MPSAIVPDGNIMWLSAAIEPVSPTRRMAANPLTIAARYFFSIGKLKGFKTLA